MTNNTDGVVSNHLMNLLEKHRTLFAAVPEGGRYAITSPTTWQARMPVALDDGEPYLFLDLDIRVDDEGHFHGQYGLTHDGGDWGFTDHNPLRIEAPDDMTTQLSGLLATWPHRSPDKVQDHSIQDMLRYVRQFADQMDGIVAFPVPEPGFWE